MEFWCLDQQENSLVFLKKKNTNSFGSMLNIPINGWNYMQVQEALTLKRR